MTGHFDIIRTPARRRGQGGATLVELMLGAAIGLFLLGGVIALFSGTRQTHRTMEATSWLQENSRHALDYLSRDVRRAGFRDVANSNAAPPAGAIRGWDGAASDPSGESLPAYSALTDVLRIRYSEQVGGAPVTHGLLYYVAPGANGQPALWQRLDAENPGELFAGVYDMQLRYGIDSDGDGNINQYVEASAVGNWDQVIAVKLDLLLGSSDDNLAEAAMTLPFQRNDDGFFSAGDRRIYQMVGTAIALRNRLI